MQSRNQIEYVGIIFNLREKSTAKGWIYSFSIPVSKMQGETELKEWMSGAIFSKEQVPGLKDRCDVHFTASLSVNAAYGDRPQSIGFFGFEIEPIFGEVYKVSKPKHRDTAESHSVAAGMNDPSPQQVLAHQEQHPTQPQQQFPDMAQSNEIPFAPIGMSEGGCYVHII